MKHEDTLREMSVERYLLGELTGDSRNSFEEHLFECTECASEVKAGVTLLEGARLELAAIRREATTPQKAPSLFGWLLSPVWLAPALAACLALVIYQSAFVVPGMRKQLAESKAPAVLNTLVLTGGAARGETSPRVSAPADGFFLLSVDIPSVAEYSSYVCTLYSPSGKPVWSGKVTLEQAKDAVQIQVPSAVTQAGENTLLVQGVRQGGPGAKMDILTTNKFTLNIFR